MSSIPTGRTLIISCLELAAGLVLLLFCGWLLLDLSGAPEGIDRHGYIATGAIAGLGLALTLACGGACLRLRSRWRWFGQAPLVAAVITLYILN
jgi:hypothetical protein